MTRGFDDLTLSNLWNKSIRLWQNLRHNNIKHVSLLILKINFLTLIGCGVKITPDFNPIYGFSKNLWQSQTDGSIREATKKKK